MVEPDSSDPLQQAVLEIESYRYFAQNPTIFGDGNFEPEIAPIPGTPLARSKIVEAIKLTAVPYNPGYNPGYIGRRHKRQSARKLNNNYADLLSSYDISPEIKNFAISQEFRSYIAKIADSTPPGPHILKVLEAIKEEDPDVLNFIADNFELLAMFDNGYWKLKERTYVDTTRCRQCGVEGDCDVLEENKKEAKMMTRKLASFQQFTYGILGMVLKTNSENHLKQIIRKNASFLSEPTVAFIKHKFNPVYLHDSYNPGRYWERIQEIFALAPKENHDAAAYYLFMTAYFQDSSYVSVANFFDQEFHQDNQDQALAVAEFFKLLSDISSPWSEGKQPQLHQEEVNMFWLKEFQEGRITTQELLQIPLSKELIYQTLYLLPQDRFKELARTTSQTRSDSLLCLNQLLMSDDFCKDPDFISKLISIGVKIDEDIFQGLKLKKESLDQIVEFGKSISFLEKHEYPTADLITSWIKKFVAGEVNLKDLDGMAENFKKIVRAEAKFYATIGVDEKVVRVLQPLFQDLCFSNRIVNDIDSMLSLISNQIFPTEALVDFISENGQAGIKKLTELCAQTEAGKFDYQNEVQRDLEFLKYLQLDPSLHWHQSFSYEKFKGLEYKGDEETSVKLTSQETMESEAAAYEASKLYWFIYQRATELGRNMIVVGNRRYGEFFVTSPLRPYLEDLGVRVDFHYVHSSSAGKYLVDDIFPVSFIQELADSMPDVVLIDGTPQNFDYNGTPRYPKSMQSYLNWFSVWNQAVGEGVDKQNEYHARLATRPEYQELLSKISQTSPTQAFRISHWLPVIGEATKVVIGDIEMNFMPPGGDSWVPEVILANPVISPNKDSGFPLRLKDHKPGFFDDPDRLVKSENKEMFTPRGVKTIYQGRTEEEVINSAQEHISRVLPRMMKLTNPLKV